MRMNKERPYKSWQRERVVYLSHFRDMRHRADLLQQKLDEANAIIARLQAEALDKELPLPPKITPLEQLRRRSKAVRRVLAGRMAG